MNASLPTSPPTGQNSRNFHALRTWWQQRSTRVVVTALTFFCMLCFYAFVLEEFFPNDSYSASRGTALVASAAYGSRSQSQIAVMELNDKYLELVGETWPPSYLSYAAMLDDVAQYRPASIFLDIALVHARSEEGLQRLIDSLCTLYEQGTRVYLAALENQAGQLYLRAELQTPQAQRCYRQVGIRYDPDPSTKLAMTYPLRGNGEARTIAHSEKVKAERMRIRSAALAIAEDFDTDQILQRLQSDTPSTMALTWSLEQHAPGEWERWLGCNAQPAWWKEMIPRSLRGFLAMNVEPACPSHRHVPLVLVADPQTDATRAWLQRNIQQKHVLIGASVAGISDTVQSPIHGDIPGVYLHAMALDNLLHFGADYKWPKPLHKHQPLAFFLLALALGLINYQVYASLTRARERVQNCLRINPLPDTPVTELQLEFRPPEERCPRVWQEVQLVAIAGGFKLLEIAFSLVLAWCVFYLMLRTTQYSIQDLAQLLGIVLVLQWTGATASVVNVILRCVCQPHRSHAATDFKSDSVPIQKEESP